MAAFSSQSLITWQKRAYLMCRKVYKAWKNYGTYGHSKVISFFLLLFYNVFTKCMIFVHRLLDRMRFIHNNPRKISVELRSLNNLLNLQNYFYRIMRINRTKWKGPYCDYLFVAYFDLLLNYGVSTAVPTPSATNINTEKLRKDAIKPTQGMLDIIGCGEDAYDYNKFYPRDVTLLWISGNDRIENSLMDKLIVYIHGGGYSLSGPSHIGYCSQLSLTTECKILFIDYAKPPTPNIDIPHQVDQVLTAYFYVLCNKELDCSKVVIAGDSAGAGLCCLMLQKLSLLGLTKYHPIGTLLYSPFVDLTLSGNSWTKFANQDMIITQGLASRSGLLATGSNSNLLRSPFFSAVYAPNYSIQSNVMLFVSTTECLYDDSKALLMKLQPMDEEYSIFFKEVAYVPHAFVLLFGVIPEADEAMQDIQTNVAKWFNEKKRQIILKTAQT